MTQRIISVNRIFTGGDRIMAAPLAYIIPGKYWVVSNLKRNIQTNTRIPISEQILIMIDEINYKQTRVLDDLNEFVGTLHPWTMSPLKLILYTKIKPPRTLSLLISNSTALSVSFLIQIESTASVQELKMKIDEIEGIPPYRQELVALVMQPDSNGFLTYFVPMMNKYKLEDVLSDVVEHQVYLSKLERESGATLLPVTVVPMLMSDNLTPVTFHMDLNRDTIHSLMGEIRASKAWKIFVGEFTLYDMREEPLSNGAFTLSCYGVKANDTLYLASPP